MPDEICIRKSDGTFWEPSFPSDWDDGMAMAAMFSRLPQWYFRRIIPKQSGWWIFKRWKWERTGEIWEPERGEEFDVIQDGKAFLAEQVKEQ